MMRNLILYWFKIQAAKAARGVLIPHFNDNEVQDILQEYWLRYLQLKPEVPKMPTTGGAIMLHLSAMSTGFYQALTARGKGEAATTQLFYDIAWKVYKKMGRFSWWLAGIGNRTSYDRLLKATELFRIFPFNRPSYQWIDVQKTGNVVGFDCVKCPVAEYFKSKGLSGFCAATWCALDYPLAEMWNAKLERTGSLAGGADKCDFRWVANTENEKNHCEVKPVELKSVAGSGAKKNMEHQSNKLIFKRLGIHTQHEHFAYMMEDCQVCISEGFEALTRIRVTNGKKSIVASLNVIRSRILKPGEISLSESAVHSMGIQEGETVTVSHLHPIDSLSYVRSKIYGNTLSSKELKDIVQDIVDGNYSNVHLAAFITACAGNRMKTEEIISLTEAMISSGQRIRWNADIAGEAGIIVDKHCIGGVPGNRTTPIVVAIVTALGLTMPKTSSRAITSPAGTADTMEVMTTVTLTMEQIKQVVEKEGGCIAWGGTAKLSPADDILIRVEKALDIDSEGQLIASVLSKKAAAGSNYIIIDMPVGETAKLRSIDAANELKVEMEKVAHAIGLKLKVVITDGTQPVGRGIGPALEARDVLAVLRNAPLAPPDLKERVLLLAGELLELSGTVEPGDGNDKARRILESGKAYEKFIAICKAQGGFNEPKPAKYQHEIKATQEGIIAKVDNRRLAKVAKLAGAPNDKASGVDFLAPVGSEVEKGQTLYVIHAESKGELEYALEYCNSQQDILTME